MMRMMEMTNKMETKANLQMSSVSIPTRTFFRIGDVAKIVGVKPYVIRFWESEFPFVAPDKASSGQRVYRRSQIEALVLVKHLLHIERYSIEGAKKKLTELRRQAKLKETMLAVVDGGMTSHLEKSSSEALAVGSVIPKEQIGALQEQVEDLQKLIRDPVVNGVPVAGLKSLS
jgi:DNA-binding transcriptional MerR regulator